jgi:hypothetical protein
LKLFRTAHDLFDPWIWSRRMQNGFEVHPNQIEFFFGVLIESNLAQVRRLEFNPTGVSPETSAVAKALGSCLVDSPDLQAALVSILAPRDQQRISERLDTAEALVVEAILALSKRGAEHLYAGEFAVESTVL